MKILLLLGAVLVPFFLQAQSIFDSSSSYTPTAQRQCMWRNNTTMNVKEQIDILQAAIWSTRIYENENARGFFTPDIVPTPYKEIDGYYKSAVDCTGNGYARSVTTEVKQSWDGLWAVQSVSMVGSAFVEGVYRQIASCPPDYKTSANFSNTDSTGALKCYDPIDLEYADSCDAGDVLPFNGNSADQCLLKPDGSMCSYETVTAQDGSSWLQQKLETVASCYSELPTTPTFLETATPDPTEQTCTVLVNGSLMCPEIPSDFSDENGNPNAGCGSFSNGFDTNFVCFGRDTDADGYPDYSDPDIDNDGIMNAQDSDADGDGIPNGTDNDYVNYGTGSSTNTGGSGGSSTDVSGIESRLDGINESINNQSTAGMPSESAFNSGFDAVIASGVDAIKDEFGKSAIETCIDGVCGSEITGTETDFINTAFGSYSTSSCINPVWIKGQVLDFCSKAPTVNEFLYWIVAMLTSLFLLSEFHTTLRRNT